MSLFPGFTIHYFTTTLSNWRASLITSFNHGSPLGSSMVVPELGDLGLDTLDMVSLLRLSCNSIFYDISKIANVSAKAMISWPAPRKTME
jgi:hypothetical protein